MLQSLRNRLLLSLRAVKVWVLRNVYRFKSAHSWRGHTREPAWKALAIPTDGTAIGARHYPNPAGGVKPLIVFFHGGGWVLGDLRSHHPFCQALSGASGCSVIAVDYRRAPEHPFPTAQDDCLAAARWISANAGQLGPCSGQLVIAGDSAGGHLAAATCLELDSASRAKVIGKILIYPVVDHYSANHHSYTEKATGYLLTSRLMQWFWDTYLGSRKAGDPELQRAFPLLSAHLATLPPTLLATAEHDPLRDEGKAWAGRLKQAGVPVDYHHFGDAAHGFASSDGPNADLRALLQELTRWLGQLPAPNEEASP